MNYYNFNEFISEHAIYICRASSGNGAGLEWCAFGDVRFDFG